MCAFELMNPQPCDMDLNVGAPIGTIHVKSGGYFPSPEQEAEGIRAKDFKDFMGKSFLLPTPPVVRRRLLQKHGIEVPEDLVSSTRHLAEFAGSITQQVPSATRPGPDVTVAVAGDDPRFGSPSAAMDSIQSEIDARSSSFSRKNKRPLEP